MCENPLVPTKSCGYYRTGLGRVRPGLPGTWRTRAETWSGPDFQYKLVLNINYNRYQTLPPDEHSTEDHEKMLLELDEERAKAAKELEKTVDKAEQLSEEITAMLSSIAQIQMTSRRRK
ncbi:hypothetical protein DdX_14119 [Ditylenchus destructor]|uniref:Uncharacterized protein n=1 Tax=Ditylenchus destructor TaxID=166010 RepID=A0AAD4MXM2_9BILA|nr:hypothetical protein DdX_14119 [Ditylenchus destructor]